MFLHDKKINTMLIMHCFLVLLLGVGVCYAQFDTKTTEDLIRGANSWVFSMIRPFFTVGLFLIVIWRFIDGYMKKNLAGEWMWFIGCGVFIGLVNCLPAIFTLLTKTSPR